MTMEQPELSPLELAVRFNAEAKYCVSDASVYRLSDLFIGEENANSDTVDLCGCRTCSSPC